MSEQIEYIEPTQEHVGQIVEVRDAESVGWTEATLTGILHDDFRFAARCSGDKYSVGWRFARTPRALTYAERQLRCGLKVGDRVKFVRAWEGNENCKTVSFVQSMQGSIGKVGYIKSMSQSSCCVELENNGFWYLPYFVLEKVEYRVATRRDIDAVVYVDGNPQDVFTLEHWYTCDNQPCRAVVRNNDKRFVYELSNLRVKE